MNDFLRSIVVIMLVVYLLLMFSGLAKVVIFTANVHSKHALQIYEKLSYEALNRHFCQTAVMGWASLSRQSSNPLPASIFGIYFSIKRYKIKPAHYLTLAARNAPRRIATYGTPSSCSSPFTSFSNFTVQSGNVRQPMVNCPTLARKSSP